jgi:eukaryotic-like serine/threonine-protein kinase
MLPAAVAHDRAQENTFGAAGKLLALAEAHAAAGHTAAASKAVADARALGDDDNVLVTAARLAIAAGRQEDARPVAGLLAKKLSANSRAYAKLIDAETALSRQQYTEAIDALHAARTLADLWLVRYTLGLAYLQRGNFAEALSEFELCRKRRGEATAIFLDDLPTFRYYAPVPYWLARSQEAIGMNARARYEEFLTIRANAINDPLVVDARQRLAALGQRR